MITAEEMEKILLEEYGFQTREEFCLAYDNLEMLNLAPFLARLQNNPEPDKETPNIPSVQLELHNIKESAPASAATDTSAEVETFPKDFDLIVTENGRFCK